MKYAPELVILTHTHYVMSTCPHVHRAHFLLGPFKWHAESECADFACVDKEVNNLLSASRTDAACAGHEGGVLGDADCLDVAHWAS